MKRFLAGTIATVLSIVTISGTFVYGEEINFEGETYEVIGEATADEDFVTVDNSFEERGITDLTTLEDEEKEHYISTMDSYEEAKIARNDADEEKASYDAAVETYNTDNDIYEKAVAQQAADIAAYEKLVGEYETAKAAYDAKVENIDDLTEDEVQGYSFEVSKSEKWNSGKDKVAEIKLDVDGEYYVRLDGKSEWVKADTVVKKNKINDMKKSYMNLAKQEIINNAPVKPDELNLPTLTPPVAPQSDSAKAAYEKAEVAYNNYLDKLHAYVEWLNNKTTPEPPVGPDEVEEAREEYVKANNNYMTVCVDVTTILKDAQKKVPKYIYNDEVRNIINQYRYYVEDGHDSVASNEYVVLCCMMGDIKTACYIHGRSCQVNGIQANVRGAFAINSYVEFISKYNPKDSLQVQLMKLHAFYNKMI